MEGAEYAEATIDNGRFGTRTIRFETGRLAKQAADSAAAYLDGDTVVLSATTASKKPKDQFDFFPLTVDVEERMYAAGRIPGSFFRREGRPSEEAVLTCRLIDRPLRPSFVKGLRNEVQVVETILALDPAHPYDVVAINAASLSTTLAGLPFSGPIGATRMGHVDGQWVAFPTHEELEAAKPAIKELCRAQSELVAVVGKSETADFPVFLDYQDDAFAAVEAAASAELAEALKIAGKQERESRLDAIKESVKERLAADFEERDKEISAAIRALTKKLVRKQVLRDQVRIDGRGPRDIRPLTAEVDVLPRVHGSEERRVGKECRSRWSPYH